MVDSAAHIEARIDALVDQGTHSYDDARRLYGEPAPDAADFSAEAIRARNPEMAFADDDTDIPPATADDMAHYGVNRQGWERATADEQGKRRMQAGVAASRMALQRSREDGRHAS